MASAPERWSVEKARAWFDGQPWRSGFNYLPAAASNELEMWQNFDEAAIDKELGWARELGFNAARVFLHDLMWDPKKGEASPLLARVDRFLEVAHRHGIATMLVLFDGCWDPQPALGPQSPPRPGVHNSRWVQSPGARILEDPAKHDDLRAYVQGVVSRYKNDKRVLVFDLFNEPDNANVGSYGLGGLETELPALVKAKTTRALLAKTLSWARAVAPRQPLTSGVYSASTQVPDADAYRAETRRWVLSSMDVTSFHDYGPPQYVRRAVGQLKTLSRPVLCTEYMSRKTGSTFDPILGYFAKERVWAFNWGFVAGQSQTNYPWDSWSSPYVNEPSPWFHDILRLDGTPYSADEAAYIKLVNAAAARRPVASGMSETWQVPSVASAGVAGLGGEHSLDVLDRQSETTPPANAIWYVLVGLMGVLLFILWLRPDWTRCSKRPSHSPTSTGSMTYGRWTADMKEPPLE